MAYSRRGTCELALRRAPAKSGHAIAGRGGVSRLEKHIVVCKAAAIGESAICYRASRARAARPSGKRGFSTAELCKTWPVCVDHAHVESRILAGHQAINHHHQAP